MIRPCKRPSRVKGRARRCRQISEHSIARVARHLHSEHADHDCVPDQQLHGAGPAHNSLRTRVPGQLHVARPSHAGSVGIHNRARSFNWLVDNYPREVRLVVGISLAGSGSGGISAELADYAWLDTTFIGAALLWSSCLRVLPRRDQCFSDNEAALQNAKRRQSLPESLAPLLNLGAVFAKYQEPGEELRMRHQWTIASSGRLLALFSSLLERGRLPAHHPLIGAGCRHTTIAPLPAVLGGGLTPQSRCLSPSHSVLPQAGITLIPIRRFGHRNIYFMVAGGFTAIGLLAALIVSTKEHEEVIATRKSRRSRFRRTSQMARRRLLPCKYR